MAPIKKIENEAEFDEALAGAGDKLVVVDFYADWCGPCKKIAPYVQRLAEENDDVVFLKVNVDDAEELAAAKKVSAMPTFQFYKSKEMVREFKGADEDKLKEAIVILK